MNKLLRIAGALIGLAGSVYAGPSSPPAGNYILNVSTLVAKPAFNVSSGTLRDQLKLSYGTTGYLLWVNPSGVVTTTNTLPTGGDVFKANTQTFTGLNTFSSTTTFNKQVAISVNGNSGSGTGSGGSMFINGTNEVGMPFQVFSSSPQVQPMINVINTSTSNAVALIYITGTSTVAAKVDLNLNDYNPNIQFNELGVVQPAGQFQFQVVADTMQFQAMNSGGSAQKARLGITHPGALAFYELSDNGHFVAFQAASSIGSNVTWILPSADSVGCFKSDGVGNITIASCGGGGGGASTLETIFGTAQSSPTATLRGFTGDFIGTVTGSTMSIALNPATTDFIQNTSVFRADTFNISSGTLTTQLTVAKNIFSNPAAPSCVINGSVIGGCSQTTPELSISTPGASQVPVYLDSLGKLSLGKPGPHELNVYGGIEVSTSARWTTVDPGNMALIFGVKASTFVSTALSGLGTQCVQVDNTGLLSSSGVGACGSGGGGTPSGSSGQFQYNNSGAFGGSVNLSTTSTGIRVDGGLLISSKTLNLGDLQITTTTLTTVTTNYNDFIGDHVYVKTTVVIPPTNGGGNQGSYKLFVSTYNLDPFQITGNNPIISMNPDSSGSGSMLLGAGNSSISVDSVGGPVMSLFTTVQNNIGINSDGPYINALSTIPVTTTYSPILKLSAGSWGHPVYLRVNQTIAGPTSDVNIIFPSFNASGFWKDDGVGNISEYDLLNATQTWTGQQIWASPRPSTFTYGVTVGSLTISGSGNPSFTKSGQSTLYQIIGSSTIPTIGNLAVWSSSMAIIDGGVVPAGGGGDMILASTQTDTGQKTWAAPSIFTGSITINTSSITINGAYTETYTNLSTDTASGVYFDYTGSSMTIKQIKWSDGTIQTSSSTNNQTIVISGDVTGSGTTAISATAARVQGNINSFTSSITVRGAGFSNTYGIISGTGTFYTTTPSLSALVVQSTNNVNAFSVSNSSVTPNDFLLSISSANPGALTLGVNTYGHVVSSGTTPSMGTCGSSPSVIGTDFAGVITVGSGVVTACTLNFANSWGNAPVCVVSDNSTTVAVSNGAISISAATFNTSATLGGGLIYYICVGQKG